MIIDNKDKKTDDADDDTEQAQQETLEEKIRKTEAAIQVFGSAESVAIAKTKSLADVIEDLANGKLPKLRELKTALGSGKRSMASLTASEEDLKKADETRNQMRTVYDMIRMISKAIKQQKQVVATTEQVGTAYQKELQTLKQLEAEESRRKTSAAYNTTETNARTMLGKVIRDEMSGMSQQSIEAGIRAMKEYQSTVEMGTVKWNAYEDAITRAEAHIKSFTEQQKISVAQAQSMAATGQLDGKAVSSNQIKEAQKVLGDYKGTLTDPAQVKAVEAEIAKLQERWNALNGVVQKTEMSYKEALEVANTLLKLLHRIHRATEESVCHASAADRAYLS